MRVSTRDLPRMAIDSNMPEANGLASYGQSQSVHNLIELDALRFDELLETLFRGGGVKGFDRLENC